MPSHFVKGVGRREMCIQAEQNGVDAWVKTGTWDSTMGQVDLLGSPQRWHGSSEVGCRGLR